MTKVKDVPQKVIFQKDSPMGSCLFLKLNNNSEFNVLNLLTYLPGHVDEEAYVEIIGQICIGEIK